MILFKYLLFNNNNELFELFKLFEFELELNNNWFCFGYFLVCSR